MQTDPISEALIEDYWTEFLDCTCHILNPSFIFENICINALKVLIDSTNTVFVLQAKCQFKVPAYPNKLFPIFIKWLISLSIETKRTFKLKATSESDVSLDSRWTEVT